ncbi:MAG TPA: DUF5666 domain-containing protein [Acidisoma sp.]|jgi:hypothetical protein|nr:DUF5666 domain-containing protein [Acidisoma sp.]
MMRRLLSAAAALCLLAACTNVSPEAAGTEHALGANWLRPPMPGTACRVPQGDGRMELAERGIGGTGPLTAPAAPVAKEPKPTTGIAAVITGFGSVCLADREVSMSPDLTVSVDGSVGAAAELAAGQRALLVARWRHDHFDTKNIIIRHEIVGPVQRVDAGGYRLVVAGQAVTIAPNAWVEAPLASGQWVAVSGLPDPEGGVLASRIDPAAAGAVLLRGRLLRDGARYAVGDLAVEGAGLADLVGQPVTLRGSLAGDALLVAKAEPDSLVTDPAQLFGAAVRHYAIEAVVSKKGPDAMHFTVPLGMTLPAQAEPTILGLDRTDPNGLVATSVTVAGSGFAGGDDPSRDNGIRQRGLVGGAGPLGGSAGMAAHRGASPGNGGQSGP